MPPPDRLEFQLMGIIRSSAEGLPAIIALVLLVLAVLVALWIWRR